MGVDYTAQVWVGVMADEVLKQEVTKVTQTKYNPDTGAPYEAVCEKTTFYAFGKPVTKATQIESLENANLDLFFEDFFEEVGEEAGLSSFGPYTDEDFVEDGYVGALTVVGWQLPEVCDDDDWNSVSELNAPDRWVALVRDALIRLGATDPDVRLFLVRCAG